MSPTDVARALQPLPAPKVLLVVQAVGQTPSVAGSVRGFRECLGDAVSIVVTPDPGGMRADGIGWIPSCSGISQLLWVVRGARGVVAQPELGSPAICRRLLEEVPKLTAGKAALILGREPVEALDALHTEVTDIWHGIEDERVCWRTVFALSCCAPLPPGLKDWTRIANHLIQSVQWFKYNHNDVRKALGRLGDAWGYTYRPARYQIAAEARSRGYLPDLPDPGLDIEDLFEVAMDLDVSGRRKFSGIGIECDELLLSIS